MAIPKVGEKFILGHRDWKFKYWMKVLSFNRDRVLLEYKELSEQAITGTISYSMKHYRYMCNQPNDYDITICPPNTEDNPEYEDLFI